MKSALDDLIESLERGTWRPKRTASRLEQTDSGHQDNAAVATAEVETEPTQPEQRPWPEESLENEQRFGLYHARLFPFVERRVWTPLGTGKLYKTGADYSEIVLDGTRRNPDGNENRIRVRTEDVRPIQ